MSAIPKPVSTNWYKVTTEASILTVYGFGAWFSHWDGKKNESYRCIGHGCTACAGGSSADVRYVLLVGEMASTERHWLELRRRHYIFLEKIESVHGSVVGARISVRKEWAAKNSPVAVELIDHKEVEETKVTRFCESLGCRLGSKESLKSPVERIRALNR